MTRRISLTAAIVALPLLLGGCATGQVTDESTPAPGGSTSAAPLTGTVTVFAAASLTGSFGEIETAFEKANAGVDLVFSYGGSSAIAEQIVQGAPADVFAAASPATMTTVTDAGLAKDPSNFATNTLEIAVPAGNAAGVSGLDDFADKGLKIALCAAEVPCGAAATKVFAAASITPQPDTLEQDVKAVLTKVELGEADAGLVYVTDVKAAGAGVEGVEFAGAADAVNDYPIATIAGSKNADAAKAFVAYVLSADGQSVLAAAGFGAP